MKKFIIGLCLFGSSFVFANDDEINALKARIKALESRASMNNGLKVKDMKGTTSSSSRTPASNQPQLSKDQIKKIQNSLKEYKKTQKQSYEYIEQMEEEGLL